MNDPADTAGPGRLQDIHRARYVRRHKTFGGTITIRNADQGGEVKDQNEVFTKILTALGVAVRSQRTSRAPSSDSRFRMSTECVASTS
jgi:hypothetical protein